MGPERPDSRLGGGSGTCGGIIDPGRGRGGNGVPPCPGLSRERCNWRVCVMSQDIVDGSVSGLRGWFCLGTSWTVLSRDIVDGWADCLLRGWARTRCRRMCGGLSRTSRSALRVVRSAVSAAGTGSAAPRSTRSAVKHVRRDRSGRPSPVPVGRPVVRGGSTRV